MEMFVIIVVSLIVANLIARDAKARGMNAPAWGWFTFFLMIVAVPIYVVVRAPRLEKGANKTSANVPADSGGLSQ